MVRLHSIQIWSHLGSPSQGIHTIVHEKTGVGKCEGSRLTWLKRPTLQQGYDEGYLDKDAGDRHNSTVTVLNLTQGLASWQSSHVVEAV